MITCAIKQSREYQTLKKQSGLSDFDLSSQVGRFVDTIGRMPYLDELVGANSEPYIRKELSLKKDNTTSTENILKATNTNTPEEAVINLNNTYRDKEIEILSVDNESKLYITERPNTDPKEQITNNTDDDINSMAYMNEIINRLQTLYGIDIIPITNAELNSSEWQDIVGVDQVKAFIYNGNIYINTDIATIDSPIHEMLHLLFGSMKFQNRELYNQLVSAAEQFDTYQEISQLYPNRTHEDLNEEVFITELAKHLTGQKSAVDSLTGQAKHEMAYNIYRTLDSILMGDVSVKCIPQNELFTLNLKEMAKMVNSASMQNDYRGYLNQSALSRLLGNVKSDLMKSGDLKEECV